MSHGSTFDGLLEELFGRLDSLYKFAQHVEKEYKSNHGASRSPREHSRSSNPDGKPTPNATTPNTPDDQHNAKQPDDLDSETLEKVAALAADSPELRSFIRVRQREYDALKTSYVSLRSKYYDSRRASLNRPDSSTPSRSEPEKPERMTHSDPRPHPTTSISLTQDQTLKRKRSGEAFEGSSPPRLGKSRRHTPPLESQKPVKVEPVSPQAQPSATPAPLNRRFQMNENVTDVPVKSEPRSPEALPFQWEAPTSTAGQSNLDSNRIYNSATQNLVNQRTSDSISSRRETQSPAKSRYPLQDKSRNDFLPQNGPVTPLQRHNRATCRAGFDTKSSNPKSAFQDRPFSTGKLRKGYGSTAHRNIQSPIELMTGLKTNLTRSALRRRAASPPGFWRTDMPSTQEEKENL